MHLNLRKTSAMGKPERDSGDAEYAAHEMRGTLQEPVAKPAAVLHRCSVAIQLANKY